MDAFKQQQKFTKLFNMKIFHMYGPNDSEKNFSSIISQIKDNRLL